MKTKKLNKRVLALFMTVMMCMSGFQISVFATEDSLYAADTDTTVTETVTSTTESAPTEPTTPEQPSEPTEPTAPEQPSEPTKPTTPEQPSEPTEPTAPEQPSEPTEPTAPEQPSEPTEPTTPEQPSEPTEPTAPEQPSESEQPTAPEEPTEPEKPVEPADPTAPVTPNDPETQEPTAPAETPKDGEVTPEPETPGTVPEEPTETPENPETVPPIVNVGGSGTSAPSDEVAKAENDLNDANANVEKIESEKADADRKLQEAQDEADKAAEELNAAISRAGSAETAFAAAQAALANAVTDEEKAQAQSDLNAAQTELDQAKAQLTSAQSAAENAEQLLKEAGLAAEDAAARFEEAKKAADDLKAKLEALKAEQPKEEPAADYNSALKQIPEKITSENLLDEADEKVIETYKYFAEMDEEIQQNLISNDSTFSDVFISVVDAYRNLTSEDQAQAAEKFSAADIDINKLLETDNAFNAVTAEEITTENILPASEKLVSAAKLFVELSTPLQTLWLPKAGMAYNAIYNSDAYCDMTADDPAWEQITNNLGIAEKAIFEGTMMLDEGEVVKVGSFNKLKEEIEKGTTKIAVTDTININSESNNFELKPNTEKGTLEISYSTNFNGDMFKVVAGFVLTIAGNVTLTGRKDNTGSIIFVDGGTLEMNGGTITGNEKIGAINSDTDINKAENSLHCGAGVYVKSGTFNMSGGNITGNKTRLCDAVPVTINENKTFTLTQEQKDNYVLANGKYDYPVGRGGGVFVNKGTFKMTGGIISDNQAGEGGGIYIGKNNYVENGKLINAYGGSPVFTMEGGTVENNTAKLGEGGGIYIQSTKITNSITGGVIRNNITETVEDLGGGGIYVEIDATLTINNAIITQNKAAGQGGGVAACVHGKTSVVYQSGAAIYNNEAGKAGTSFSETVKYGDGYIKSMTMNLASKPDFIDAYNDWTELDEENNRIAKIIAQDFFSAGNKTSGDGNRGAVLQNKMYNNGYANWNGIVISYDGNDKITKQINIKNTDEIIHSDYLALLTANPSEENIESLSAMIGSVSSGVVLIYDNTSLNTHGGGVANNGYLDLGTFSSLPESPTLNLNLKLDANKILKVMDTEDAANSLKDGDLNNKIFTFALLKSNNKTEVDRATNDKNGKLAFNIGIPDFDSNKSENQKNLANLEKNTVQEYTFYLKEVSGDSSDGIIYDPKTYEVKVQVIRNEDKTINVGTHTISSVKNYSIQSITIDDKSADLNQDYTLKNPLTFTNTEVKGKLTVKKISSEANDDYEEGLPGAEFTLTPKTEGSNPIVGTTDGNGLYTFNNLAVGEYTLTETKAPENYQGTTTTWSVSVELINSEAVVKVDDTELTDNTLQVTNDPIKKDLVVTKNVQVKPTSEASNKTTFEIQVKLGDGNQPVKLSKDNGNYSVSYTKDGIYTFNLANGKTATIKDIPVGTQYTVLEIETLDNNWEKLGEVTINDNKVIKNADDDANKVTITNKYNKPQMTSVTVIKNWVNTPADIMPEYIEVQLYRNGSPMSGDNYTQRLKADGDTPWSCKWDNLAVYDENRFDSENASVSNLNNYKYTYTVKETAVVYSESSDYETYTIEADKIIRVRNKEANNNNKEILGGWIVNDGGIVENNTVSISNTWIPAKDLGEASFTVHKIDSVTNNPINGVTFTLSKKDDDSWQLRELTTKTDENGDGNVVFSGLTNGTYILKETGAPSYYNYDANIGRTWEISIIKDKLESVEEVTPDEDNNVAGENGWSWKPYYSGENADLNSDSDTLTITNVIGKGQITITKDLVLEPGLNDNAEADKEFEFNVYKGDVALENIKDAELADTLKVTNKGNATTKDLDCGIYTIVEKETAINGYTWKGVTYSNGEGEAVASDNNRLVVEITENGQTLSYTATNQYDIIRGNLVINKIVEGGPATAETEKVYEFTVSGPSFADPITVTVTGEGTVNDERLNNIIPGRYIVTEKDARIGGYRWTMTVEGDSDVKDINGGIVGTTAQVIAGEDKTVTFTNNYRRIPSDPTPSNPTTPNTPSNPSTPTTPGDPATPVVDVPDPDTPLAELPDYDVPLANIPEEPDTPLSELPEPDVPLANIPDEETPLVELPEHIPLAAMPPEEVPLVNIIDGDVPKTGDMGLTMLWIMLCLFALSGITASSVPYLRRRRK